MSMYLAFRKRILENYSIKNIVLFKEAIFHEATVETCIEIILNNIEISNTITCKEVIEEPSLFEGKSYLLNQEEIFGSSTVNLIYNNNDKRSALFSKIEQQNKPLKQLAKTICGLTPYRLGKGSPKQTKEIVQKRSFDASYKKDDTYRQYIMGRDFHRYIWQFEKERWISYGDWLAEPRYTAPFSDDEKIVIRQTADRIIGQLDFNQFLSLKNVHNIRITSKGLAYPYLLGILNSKLISWWYQQLIPEKGRVFAEVKVVNLKKIPIKTIDFSNESEKILHDSLVNFVQQILDLHKKLAEAREPRTRETLQRQIDAVDAQIDRLVYELYGLTEEEVKVVEGA